MASLERLCDSSRESISENQPASMTPRLIEVLDVSDDLAAGDEDVGRFMGAQGVDLSGGYVPDLTPATISVSFL